MMRSGGQASGSWQRILLLAMAMTLWAAVAMAKDKPDIKVTKFDHPPLSINYFEDSDAIIFHDVEEGTVYRSDDAGVSWDKVKDIDDLVVVLVMHKFEPETAFALTPGDVHWKTENRGKSWKTFKSGSSPSQFKAEILVFHADDPKKIIFNGMDCDGIFCNEEATYTTDGFHSVDYLRAYTNGCWWAKSSKEFTTGEEEKDNLRTMCIVQEPFSFLKEDQRLHISDSFFAVVDEKIDEFEPNADGNQNGVDGVVNLAVVKKYLLVASKSLGSDEMALYVSDDTVSWHRAMFPTDDSHDHSHQINQNAYTVLESTNYSIQVDVMTSHPGNPMGVLFTSNSNGTYFTENLPYTNRNDRGHVDFEKITGVQGVYLVNMVDNGEEVEKKGEKKKKVSRITFDDGRTFEELTTSGGDKIHLHSETELDNVGRVFSSMAPGLVMGNGNAGKSLGDFTDSNLYVSDDAGLTWEKALDGPHKYEFGDSGSVLMAIRDSLEADVKEFSWSLNHGEDWDSVELPDGLSIKPDLLTTTQDSTSLKFLLLGEKEGVYHMIAVDFEGLKQRKCKKGDMEDWHARVDEDGKPTCIMGHKQTYQRRKKNADCFIKDEFTDPEPETEDCECTDADFECDFNFQRDPEDPKKCKKVGPIAKPDGACSKDDDTFMGTSGWRLIPGNTCKRGEGDQLDDEQKWDCSDSISPPSAPGSGEIDSTKTVFKDAMYKQFQKIYLDRSGKSSSDDETIIVRSVEPSPTGVLVDPKIWITHDHGKKWDTILDKEEIHGIFPHQHLNDFVFFTTKSEKVIYTADRGRSFHSFQAPTPPGKTLPISFHPDNKDWLLWVGQKCDGVSKDDPCHEEASLSRDRGDDWETIVRYVKKCEFTGQEAYKGYRSQNQIVCLAHEEENPESALTVKTSDDFFKTESEFKGEVTDFATMSEFIVLAGTNDETKELQAYASLNGELFEPARFPYNFHEGHDNEYTVLDSSTHAINLFVLAEGGSDRQYGSVIKSNTNGTSYVLSASKVNCDENMFVDFEKIPGIEGVVLVNVVAKEGKKKEIQSKISHNDGNEWAYLAPPSKDVDGKSYGCSSSKGDESCALHVHHYTERIDRSKTFGAVTAIGLVFAVGNVGSKLSDIEEADTFMSTDAGMTWQNVKKGRWTWQYGDQGSIIVLVQRAGHKNDVKTKSVSYSTDEGKTWQDYEFADSEVTVTDITTSKTGSSRNFLIWAKNKDGKLFTANLDFTGLADRPCEFNEDINNSDYYLWSPMHPLQDNGCLFGHKSEYLRKKPDNKCYNEKNLKRLHGYKTCDCTRQDFECAYNFELDGHNQCSLVPGFKPLSGKEWCEKNPDAKSYFEPTGYRKLGLSTCKDGVELDKTSAEHACKGHEGEFEDEHRTSGVAIFFAVIIPFGLAAAIGWYVFRNWSGNFGQIRLGDNATSSFDSDQPWVKYPVIAVSAVAAVAASTPLLLSSIWRTARGAYERVGGGSRDRSWFSSGPRRFTTRDSFARGRGDYSMVDDDEGELLGEDSDEEV